MSPVVPVLACSSRYDAELARSFFEAYGLQVFFKADDYGGMHPPLTFLHEVTLQVRESDANKADSLLDSIANHELEDPSDPSEHERLRRELGKAVRGVFAGVFFIPLIMQPFALLQAFRVMREIVNSPQATRTMRNQIRGAVLVSSLVNVLLIFQVVLLMANDYLVLWEP